METLKSIFLQLGDIIQIKAPSNNDIDEKIYIIDYIDTTHINLKSPNSNTMTVLNINSGGNLSDESIKAIDILSRAESNSYAKQHNLLPGTFIDVYFGGDIPVTITGEITNLEEDMIEIKLYETNELIYIDFGYKGIPEDIPIKEIVIRTPPEQISDTPIEPETLVDATKEKEKEEDEEEEEEEENDALDNVLVDDTLSTIQIPTEEIKKQLKDILLDADQIEFGPELESIDQIVEVPDERKRYGLETQVNELLDELLSSVPNAERTRSVINNIHTELERFKQLRA